MKICSDICPQMLSVPRSKQFSASVAQKKNCELQRTDNVQGQISEHIFTPNGGYCVYYPSNLFRNARSFEFQLGNIRSRDVLDLSRTSENI